MPAAARKTTGILFLSLILSFLFLGGCSTPAGNPDDGKKWFVMNNCGSCHGPNGDDGRAVPIANLDMSFASFLRKLRSTDGQIMPSFPESRISEKDAADIYAFLKSEKKEVFSKK